MPIYYQILRTYRIEYKPGQQFLPKLWNRVIHMQGDTTSGKISAIERDVVSRDVEYSYST